MCENLHYESVYFKELHNEQEYYWQTIYRAGAAVVSTITRFKVKSDHRSKFSNLSNWKEEAFFFFSGFFFPIA